MDQHIFKEAKMRQKNVAMALIDDQKSKLDKRVSGDERNIR